MRNDMRDIKNEDAMVSIDFMVAIAIFMIAFMYVIYVLSGMVMVPIGEVRDIHPLASRVGSILVNDPGEPDYWAVNWTAGNYAGIDRIGFAVDRESHNVLNKSKIDALMTNHTAAGNLTWWEYPVDGTPDGELKNATRALGLDPYDFYMQIRPIDAALFNVAMADEHAEQNVVGTGDIIRVERIVIIKSEGGFITHNGAVIEYNLILWMW